MTKPIHSLGERLEAARMEAIEKLAGSTSAISNEALQRLVFVQIALTAVREEILAHETRLGGGSEKPLA